MVEQVRPAPRGASMTGLIGNRFLLAGLVIALAVGFLIFSRSRVTMVYYYTVSEVTSAGEALAGKQIRVRGRVADGSIQSDEASAQLRFTLTDESGAIQVEYTGVTPDLFGYARDGRYQDVVVEGRYRGDNVIVARQLIVAHDSQYEAATPSGRAAGR